MNVKKMLALIYGKNMLPYEEFIVTPEFKALEDEPEIIEEIEVYRLPEVTKLISFSDKLLKKTWAKKYEEISQIYRNPEISSNSVVNILLKYEGNESKFETEILYYSDENLFNQFKNYFKGLHDQYEELRKNKGKWHNVITEIAKEIELIQNDLLMLESNEGKVEESSSENEISKSKESNKLSRELEKKTEEQKNAQKEFDKVKTDLDQLSGFLKKWEEFDALINNYDEIIRKSGSDENREAAYQVLLESKASNEEMVINDIISTGTVNEAYYSYFYDSVFVSGFLNRLSKSEYKDYSIQILVLLYENGLVDLVEGVCCNFIERHPAVLRNYLNSKMPDTAKELTPEIEFFIQKAAQLEIQEYHRTKSSTFSVIWNSIKDVAIWNIIFDAFLEKNTEELNQNICCYIQDLKGKNIQTILELLNSTEYIEKGFSIIEICAELMKLPKGNADFIMAYLRLMDSNNKKIQRKLNTVERRLKCQGQELFSSIYSPVEQLEELTINLKKTVGEVKSNIISNQLIGIVETLRDGLSMMDLHTVADFEDWKHQNKVEFNSNEHRLALSSENIPEEVWLSSLGFKYTDDEGNLTIHSAQVFVEDEKRTINKEKSFLEQRKLRQEKRKAYNSKEFKGNNNYKHKNKKNKNRK